MADSIENIINRSIERFMASRFSERHGLVTSYDSKKHLAKVMLKPQNQESGWLPIETGHIGKGYGIAIGLKPGSGVGAADGADEDPLEIIPGTDIQDQGVPEGFTPNTNPIFPDRGPSPPAPPEGLQAPSPSPSDIKDINERDTGDQVIVRFQEGDFEGGKIVQRVHSNEDTPPEVKSGEIVMWTKFDKQSSSGGAGGASGGGASGGASGGAGGAGGASGGGQQSTGQKVFFKEDGSISVEDGAGAKQVMDGKGNMTLTAT